MERSYLGLRLAGSLQSWAGQAAIKTRVDTEDKPSERALLGFLSAAFGLPRGESLPNELQGLDFQVKSLKQGLVTRDYQTIGPRDDELLFAERVGRILVNGKKSAPSYSWPGTSIKGRKYPAVVNRTFLADAEMLVLVAGDKASLLAIQEKLRAPIWSPYLGKKAFPLTEPYILGIKSGELSTVAEEFEQKVFSLKEMLGLNTDA